MLTMVGSEFIHLHTHSHYSLLDGLTKVDELVDRAKELGMGAVALTDHGNLYGAVEFYKKATSAGIKPILGVEVYMAANGMRDKRPKIDEVRYHLPLLVKNEKGWRNLLQLVTKSYLEGFYYKPRIDKELLEQYAEGLVCFSGCFAGEIPKLLSLGRGEEAESVARFYQRLFGEDFYIEVMPHIPTPVRAGLISLAQKISAPLVATQDSHYIHKDDKTAHEILLAVQTHSKVDDEDRLSLADYDVHFKTGEEMAADFADIPEALANTTRVATRCSIALRLGVPRLPKFATPAGQDAMGHLRALAYERVSGRFSELTAEVKDRLEMELGVIGKTGYADYFLIVQDFIRWAKTHGIVVGPGRGSAAGSLVSYVLGITNIDPLRYDLIFERFLNPDRNEMPDIDIDFTDTRRDEVIAYVREKYGADRVGQIITFGTMMARAAVRDTTRALGLPYSLGDQIAKLIPFNVSLKEAMEVVELKKLYEENEDVRRILDAGVRLEGTVRHASVHACGVVISAEPLPDVLPLQYAPQGDETILTQFEMHSVEDLGLLKMDFLGLKNLTIIERTLRLVKELHGVAIDIDNLPLDDEKTFELYKSGEMVGIFQLESAGMRRYLKQLKPTELEDIIAMVSLYRPGPMDLIPQYIRRKHGEEQVTYIHPRLEPILKSTYGVGVYQEQMMRIARDLAGYTLSDADTLRKAIGKKVKELLDEQQEKIVKGMVANGIDTETAKKIWELFPPFARYGFNRSHGACYAMISYQTAYLKAHYPVEFMTSLLNTSGHDTDRINFLVQEAKRLGINVFPPDINASYEDFAVSDNGKDIRFGLFAIKNVGETIVGEIINERTGGGPYQGLAGFLSRVHHRDLNRKSLESLIKCGAFDSIHADRAQLLQNIDELLRFGQASKKLSNSNQHNLFGSTIPTSSLRLAPASPIDRGEVLRWEKELLGLYVTEHPFRHHMAKVEKIAKPIREIREYPYGVTPEGLRMAGVVSAVKKVVTRKGDPMLFATLEDTTDKIETLVFPRVLARNPDLWQEGKVVLLAGTLSWRDEEPKVICDEVREL
jgi:DNA polymerase III subunit alpha